MSQPQKFKDDEKVIVKVDPGFKHIFPVFWNELGKNIEGMRTALKQSGYDTVGLLAHKTLGSAANMGFDVVAEFCLSLELTAKAHSSREVRELLDGMENYLKHVEVVYV